MDVFYLVKDKAGGLVFPDPVINLKMNLGSIQNNLDEGLASFDDVTDL